MEKIIRFFTFNPSISFLSLLILGVLGVFAYRTLPIDAVPDITNVQVQINTSVKALTPQTAESTITYPIESVMSSIPNAEDVRSLTRYGLSQVTVIFTEGTDIYRARQLVSEKLRSLELPAGVVPQLGPISTGLGEVFHYALEARVPAKDPEKRLKQLMDLRTIQEWEVKPRLLYVRGVAEVNTIGGFPEQYYIQPNLKKMSQAGVHLDELEQAIRENNRNAGGGYIRQTAEQFLVQGDGLIKSLDEIKGIPVKRLPDFTVIRVGDVADVRPDRELRTGAAVLNGEETILGTVFMLLGENSRTVSLNIAKKVGEIQKNLPDWVRLTTVYNRSELVNSTIGTVRGNLIFGACLVAVTLLFLTGNIRAALLTALIIPISLICTLILMKYTEISANLMSLGALDFGVIIDGAVIVVDACVRKVQDEANARGRKLTRAEVREATVDATVEIRRAAGFGQMIIIVVFLPLFALTGVEGKMFRPMAAAFCFALLAAFILAFTVLPALAGSFLKGNPREKENFLIVFLEEGYQKLLAYAFRFRAPLLATALLLPAGGSLLYFTLGGEFVPRLYEGALAVQFIRPVNVSLDGALKLEKKSHEIIREFGEVKTVFARLGTAEIAVDPMGVNLSDAYVMLHPASKWPLVKGRRRTPVELAQAIKEKLETELPGQRLLLSQPVQLRFNELLEGSRADLSLKVYGDDLDTLMKLSTEIGELIRQLPGAGDVEPELRGRSPILHITPRREMLYRLGVSRKELLDALQTGVGGEKVGYLYRGVRRFPLLVRLADADRESLSALRNLPVGLSQDFTLPLHRLATLEFRDSYLSIKRDSSRRRAAILINPSGRDTESLVNLAKEKIAEKIKLPPGYYLEWGGNFRNLQKARASLILVGIPALLVVFYMVFLAFQDLRTTLLVFGLIPFALSGGIINLALMGLPFSISAGVGFIAVSGIAVLNGVVLAGFAARLAESGLEGAALAQEAARLRLRAILMTAFTDIAGFLPMMLASGIGAEVQRPVATVVIGGMVTATFATLFLLPVWLAGKERKTGES